jgi:RNA polymerase sigma-70 factor (ECF subfamily)
MLQVVLGFDARNIAKPMLVSPSALAQRLVRAKRQLAAQASDFVEPERAEMPARLPAVLEAVYALLVLGAQPDSSRSAELDHTWAADTLADVLAAALPEEPEALALAALARYCRARNSRDSLVGTPYVPLDEQDAQGWDQQMINDAERLLSAAARLRQPGPMQLEAAIQSAHCQRRMTGETPWNAIASLYSQLNAHWPTIGSRVAGAVAIAKAGQLEDALLELDGLPSRQTMSYQPWWAARAHILAQLGRASDANRAYLQAINCTQTPSVRRYLEQQLLLHELEQECSQSAASELRN